MLNDLRDGDVSRLADKAGDYVGHRLELMRLEIG